VACVTHEDRRGGGRDGEVGAVQTPDDTERKVDIAELGSRLAALRLCEPAATSAMRRSLVRHGQLSPVLVFLQDGQLEVMDGFKRVHAARALGWTSLRARVTAVGAVEAKLLLAGLHEGRGLTELEEGWLIRSLYREDHLQQGVIAQRLGRHKSWVCRRLMLVETLDQAVQADVRLGLLPPRAALAVGQLPRGNQLAAAQLVIRRGLTVRQIELLVAELMDRPDDGSRAQQIARWMDGNAPGTRSTARPSRETRSEVDWLSSDIRTVRQVASRLQARLCATPLGSLGPDAAVLLADSLAALAPVLEALQSTLAAATGNGDRLERKAA
jgi:ParB-like chromosome segregation protein Spo0J